MKATAMYTTVQYRLDARPFETRGSAAAAIAEYKAAHPNDAHEIRDYDEGFYVLIHFPLGGNRWLTRRMS